MNPISVIWNALLHTLFAAFLFLMWKMWEDVIMHALMSVRKNILGRSKVKANSKEECK